VNPTIMEFQNVSKDFGGLRALDGVDFSLRRGEIRALIGPNGAGKTTCLKIINGILHQSDGEVFFEGQALGRLRPHERCKLGIGSTFQVMQLFKELTVLENVVIGRHCRSKSGILSTGLRLPHAMREERQMIAKSMDILEFIGLEAKAYELARNLTAGQQRLLEMSRALATEPKLLLLDEPAAGLNSSEKEELASRTEGLCRKGITILLVEHDMPMVMSIANSVTVLDFGRVIAEGPPQEVQCDQQVIAAYLGAEVSRA
jgi:branched-chain amino acid transport system ATP-binding protein